MTKANRERILRKILTGAVSLGATADIQHENKLVVARILTYENVADILTEDNVMEIKIKIKIK